MKNKNCWVFVSLLFVLIIGTLSFLRKNNKTKPKEPTEISEVKYFDKDLFNRNIRKAENGFKSVEYKIYGAVTNHFNLAGFATAAVIKRISEQKPTLLIILGPNHYEVGDFNIITSLNSWKTDLGIININMQIVEDLVAHGVAKVDEKAILNDHTTTSLLPYIKFYLPDVTVAQLLLSKKMTLKEAKELSATINKNLNEDSVVIASVDFSHYLTSGEANIKDEETLSAINNFDYLKLFSYGSEYLDSPASLSVLLMLMQNFGKTRKEILYHGNSSDIQPDLNSFVTSYYSILYH